MSYLSTTGSWIAMLALIVPLAIMLLLALPSGAPVNIAMHVMLLVGGASIVMALRPDETDRPTL